MDKSYTTSSCTVSQAGQAPLPSSSLNRFGETNCAYQPQVFYPWRRYFARMLDLAIYGIFADAARGYLFGANLAVQGNLSIIVSAWLSLAIMFVAEPLLLCFFGTTLGKAVFGLHVRSVHGRNLRYAESLARVGSMFWHGMGANIPFYNLYRQCQCYKSCEQGELLPWDADTAYTIADTKRWRIFAFFVVHLLLLLLQLALVLGQLYPPNRGDLTVAQFSENFNYYCSYYGFDANGYTMAQDGSWREAPPASDGSVKVYLFEEDPMPAFTFVCTEAGIIQEIQIAAQAENREFAAPSYQNYQLMGGMAVLGAQSKCPVLPLHQYAKVLEAAPNQSAEFTAAGAFISWDIALEGYIWTDYLGYFYVDDPTQENSYTLAGVIVPVA